MFYGLFRMHETCPFCRFRFEREPGYFSGAMMISSVLTTFIISPIWLAALFKGYSFWIAFLSALLPSLILAPLMFQYSRVIWLYMDFVFHPE